MIAYLVNNKAQVTAWRCSYVWFRKRVASSQSGKNSKVTNWKKPNNPTKCNTKITTSYASYVYNTKDNKLNVKAKNLVNMELHNTKYYNWLNNIDYQWNC